MAKTKTPWLYDRARGEKEEEHRALAKDEIDHIAQEAGDIWGGAPLKLEKLAKKQ